MEVELVVFPERTHPKIVSKALGDPVGPDRRLAGLQRHRHRHLVGGQYFLGHHMLDRLIEDQINESSSIFGLRSEWEDCKLLEE